MAEISFPKKIAADPAAARLARGIAATGQPLWERGELRVARVDLDGGLLAALQAAHAARRVVRGLEAAGQALAAEARGLAQVDRETGVARGGRVSRLLVVTRDGAERFYRNVESLVARHAPRVLALQVDADERQLGEPLFGAGHVARLLLVEHKDAVSSALLAIAAQWQGEGDAG